MRKSLLSCVLLSGLALTACSDNKEEMVLDDRTMISTTDPLEAQDMMVDGNEYDSQNLDGPTPGTQEDLIVNVGDRVYFGYDRFDLTSEAMTQLEMQAKWLQQYQNLSVTIEGHADERGTREYNLALGDRRATSVKNYLISLGVSPSRINTISYGKELPEVLGSNPQSWARNRRAVTKVQ